MFMALLRAPVCLVSNIIPLRPKPQEVLRDFLYPDGTISVLRFKIIMQTHTNTCAVVLMAVIKN